MVDLLELDVYKKFVDLVLGEHEEFNFIWYMDVLVS